MKLVYAIAASMLFIFLGCDAAGTDPYKGLGFSSIPLRLTKVMIRQQDHYDPAVKTLLQGRDYVGTIQFLSAATATVTFRGSRSTIGDPLFKNVVFYIEKGKSSEVFDPGVTYIPIGGFTLSSPAKIGFFSKYGPGNIFIRYEVYWAFP